MTKSNLFYLWNMTPLIDATGLRPAEFICGNYLYSELTDRRFPRRKLVESHIRFIDQSDPR